MSRTFPWCFLLSVCFRFIKVLGIVRYRTSLGAEADKRIFTTPWSPSPRVLAGTVRFGTRHPGRLQKLPCDSDKFLVILVPRGSLASRCAQHRSATITELRCHPFNRTMDVMSFLRADLADFPGSVQLIRPLRLKFGFSGLLSLRHAVLALICSQNADALLYSADPNELWEPRWAVAE